MASSLASSKGLTVLALATLAISSFALARYGGGGETAEPPDPASTAMAATMMRAGLDAQRLAAVGADTTATSDAISDAITEHDSGTATTLAQADLDFSSCKPVCTELERKIRSGKGTQEDVTAYQTATADLATREATRDGVIDEIFEAAIADLSQSQQATLRTIRGNAHWKLPVQYLTVDRTEAEWVQLRDYLDARRIYTEQGEEVPSSVTSLLATVESATEVATAKANIDSNLAGVQTAWNAAVTE